MAKEENLKSKSLYKLLLIMLKYIPMLIALFYVINTATAYKCFSYTIIRAFFMYLRKSEIVHIFALF